MEPRPIYFETESPDFNMGLYGKPERLAANRTVLCIISEFGLCNNARMQAHQVNALIESLQTSTGTFKESRINVKLKSKYIKKRHLDKPITTLITDMISEHTGECSLAETTS